MLLQRMRILKDCDRYDENIQNRLIQNIMILGLTYIYITQLTSERENYFHMCRQLKKGKKIFIYLAQCVCGVHAHIYVFVCAIHVVCLKLSSWFTRKCLPGEEVTCYRYYIWKQNMNKKGLCQIVYSPEQHHLVSVLTSCNLNSAHEFNFLYQ